MNRARLAFLHLRDVRSQICGAHQVVQHQLALFRMGYVPRGQFQ